MLISTNITLYAPYPEKLRSLARTYQRSSTSQVRWMIDEACRELAQNELVTEPIQLELFPEDEIDRNAE